MRSGFNSTCFLLLIIAFLAALSGSASAVSVSSCTTISSPGSYALTTSITNSGATKCIEITSSNVVFDGQGYAIDGTDTANTYGIYVYNSGTSLTNVTIKNLIVTDWYYGITYQNTQNGSIANNIVSSNNYGILPYSSSSNTITNNTASSNSVIGIYFSTSSNNNTLTSNTANSNGGGIYLYSSGSSTLINNTASSNTNYGIGIGSSSNNTLINNTASSNSDKGISLSSSSNNTLSQNIMSNNRYNFDVGGSSVSHFDNNIGTSNTVDGKPVYYVKNAANTVYDSSTNAGTFYCISCNNVTVKDLTLTKNYYGVFFWSTNNSKIENVNASSNAWGIYLHTSSNSNTITNNTASSNAYGIDLDYSSNSNTITNNTASSNSYYGIYLFSSSYNTIYNNYFRNTNNFYLSYSSPNTWNTTKTLSTNIVGGPYLGGNFWAYPNGTGYSETCTDGNSDGICDSSYNPASGNVDYLPLSLNLGQIGFCFIISSPGSYVLVTDIINSGVTTTCIKIASSDVIFEGRGHTIDGIDVGASYGAYVYNSSTTLTNVTVKNLKVTDWYYGIYYRNAQNGLITNNSVNSNIMYGISLDSSSNITLTNNTAILNNYGIYIYSSGDNTLTNNIASGNARWDFYSFLNSINNIVINLTMNPIISFTGKDVAIRAATAPANDPSGYHNISKYVNATNTSANSWLPLNVSYSDSDVSGLNESSLRMWKHNGTVWSQVPAPNGVEAALNYVYANITRFSIFAPMAALPPYSLGNLGAGGPYAVGETVNATWDVTGESGAPNYINVEYYDETDNTSLALVSYAFSPTKESDNTHVVQPEESGDTVRVYIYFADNVNDKHGDPGTSNEISDTYTVAVPEFPLGLVVLYGMLAIVYFSKRKQFMLRA